MKFTCCLYITFVNSLNLESLSMFFVLQLVISTAKDLCSIFYLFGCNGPLSVMLALTVYL